MQKKLAIFDYHGTLVSALENHDIAYRNTVKELFGVEGSIHDTYFAASTNQHVTIGIARARGVPERLIKQKQGLILSTYEKHFIASLQKFPPKVLSGIQELLELLVQKNFVIVLYSGDSKKTLAAILEKTGLKKYFSRELIISASSRKRPEADRKKLLAEAIRTAEKEFGRFSRENVFLFDDSARGVQAGKELGIVTVAVGTGPEGTRNLREAGPSFLFQNFRNPKRAVEKIERLQKKPRERRKKTVFARKKPPLRRRKY